MRSVPKAKRAQLNSWLSVVALVLVAMTFQNCKPVMVADELPEGSVDLPSIVVEKNCGLPRSTPVQLRSLSNEEYKNAVYDVLGVQPDLSSILPTNALGPSGFRNDAQALGNFDLDHLNKFYNAAERVASDLIAGHNNSSSPYFKVFHCSITPPPSDALVIASNLKVAAKDMYRDPDAGTFGANSGTEGYMLWSNGRISQKFFATKTGAHAVTIRALQTDMPANFPAARMVVMVNGAVEQEINVTSTVEASYVVNLNLVAGAHDVVLLFDNDGMETVGANTYDRNLIVRNLTWTGLPPGPAAPTGNACLQKVFTEMSARLFRMGDGEAEVTAQATRMVNLVNDANILQRGLGDAVVSLLMDPRFMLVRHAANDGKLTEFGLASKLSFLLWQSVPDDTLRAEATAARLSDPAVLKAQVKRMLQDDRAKRLASVLRKEWLGLASFESATFTGLSTALQNAYTTETSMFLEDLIQSDRPLNWLLESKQTFVNKELAEMYGLSFPAGTPANQFVALSTVGTVRQGILTHASVLAATAGGTTVTHPVRRGVWIQDRILCEKPPPPPPGIPALPTDVTNEGSIRARLEVHTKTASCAGCHQKMDLYGLGMENFDPFGKWRERYHDNSVVESYGSDRKVGLEFANSRQLVEQLPKVSQAHSCIAQSLVRLGENRPANSYEKCASSHTGYIAFNSGTVFSDYVYELVSSPNFSMQAE